MAHLELCDTHNMVAYLLKAEGREGFHQIMDFLNTSDIKYAITRNPTIYVSLIQQFWQTAAVKTLDTKEVHITATIDGKVKLVFEASIRRHLKLKDSDGISTFPNTKIFEQLALMGIPIRQETKVPRPSSPPHTNVADEAASIGVDVRHGGAATIVSSLDAGHGSGNINKTPSMPYDSPILKVHTLRSDDGIMQQNEFMDLVTKLTDRVLALETDLQQTKKVYSTAFTKLIMKVKKLEKIVKSTKARRRAKIIVSDDEDATKDTSKQGRKIDGIDQHNDISLVQHYAEVQGKHEQEIKFETKDISISETLVYIRRSASKDKSKGIMTESEPEQTTTKVHEEASSFNVEEWEGIQASIEADEELALRIQVEEREKYSKDKKARLLVDLINQRKRHFAQQRAEERRNKPLTQAQQRTYMSNYVKHIGSHTLQQLKRFSFDELKNLFEATIKMVKKFTPMESDVDRTIPKIADESSKRATKEELEQESSKRQKTRESSEPREKEDDELTQEDL
nr:xylulose kinase-1 [Tanacetum cinerariifolium]